MNVPTMSLLNRNSAEVLDPGAGIKGMTRGSVLHEQESQQQDYSPGRRCRAQLDYPPNLRTEARE
jgi:hypothetical protein